MLAPGLPGSQPIRSVRPNRVIDRGDHGGGR
jgi:hypothetical protein